MSTNSYTDINEWINNYKGDNYKQAEEFFISNITNKINSEIDLANITHKNVTAYKNFLVELYGLKSNISRHILDESL
jgi:hypothetical protein